MGLFDSVANLTNSTANAIAAPFGGRQTVIGRGLSDMALYGIPELTDASHNGLFPDSRQQIQGPGMPVSTMPVGGQPGGGWGAVANETTRSQPVARAPDGMPLTPDYTSIRDQTGHLYSPYQINPQKMGDSSSWQSVAKQQNDAQTRNLVDNTNQKSLAATQDAMSQLEMNGGLSSGARERVAEQGSKNAMMGTQDAYNQGNLNNLGISLQGEQMNRDSQQQNVTNDLNAQTHNTGLAAGDVGNLNNAAMTGYGEANKDWIGRYLANSQANAYNSQPQSIWDRVIGGIF